MNNFASSNSGDADASVPRHLEQLSTSIFQSLFPAISPATTSLNSIQRVLLLNRESPKSSKSAAENDPPYVLNLRHYAIGTKRVGLPKAIRRINAAEKVLTDKQSRRKGLPNLGNFTDMADYLLDPGAAAGGFTSGSESEAETDAEVEIMETQARKVISRKKSEKLDKQEEKSNRVEKRAIKLSELGPRVKLRLTKVEEGVCGGKVMWHEWIKKSRREEKQQDETWNEKRRLKEERKQQQRANVAKKKGKGETDEGDLDDEWDSEDFEDNDGEGGAEESDEDDEDMDIEMPTASG